MKFSVSLQQNEEFNGWIYLFIDLFALPAALCILNAALPVPMAPAVQNFLFFCINFVCVGFLLRKFLLGNLPRSTKALEKILFFAVLGFLLYQAVNHGMKLLFQAVKPGFVNINDDSVISMLDSHYGIMFFGTVFLVPVTEELLFRGVVFRGLYARSATLGWIVSIAFFALIHVMSYLEKADFLTLALCYIQYIPAALILAWCYGKSGSIFTPILIHMGANLVGILTLR